MDEDKKEQYECISYLIGKEEIKLKEKYGEQISTGDDMQGDTTGGDSTGEVSD